MAEELLDGADVVAILEQMGRKRMSEGVTADVLADVGPLDCLPHRAL